MSTIVEVVGVVARDALLATVTASQVTCVGGGQTYVSSSYYTGGLVGAFDGTLVPDQDVATGSFITAPLWTALTSSVAGVVTSESGTLVTPTSSVEEFSVAFSTPAPSPNANEVVTVRVDAAKSGSNEASILSSSVNLTISVRTSGSEAATRTVALPSSSFESYTFQLTESEKVAIGWDDFDVQCSYEMSVDSSSLEVRGQARYVQVDFFKPGVIEAPPQDDTVWRILYV